MERTRKQLAHDLVRELRTVDADSADIEERMTVALSAHGSRLRAIDGAGAVAAVPTHRPDRRATYVGVAPIKIASCDRTRPRLARSGDSRFNSGIHLPAVTQVRTCHSIGRADAPFVNLYCYFSAAEEGYRMNSLDVDAVLIKADGIWPVRPHDCHWPPHLSGRIAVAQSSADHWEMFFPDNAPRLTQVLETFLDPSDPSHR